MLLTASPRPPLPLTLIIPLLVLLAAYFYAVATRPPVPEHVKEDDPHRWGWPREYDKPLSASGAQSGPETGQDVCEDPVNLLFFIDLAYNSMHMPQALATLSALSSDPSINLTVITPFSPPWNASYTVKHNLEAAGCGDKLWRIGDTVRNLDGACPNSTLISEVLLSAHREREGLSSAIDGRANVTVLSQPHHLVDSSASYSEQKAQHGPEWRMGLFTHVLPAADPNVYFPSRTYMSRKSVTYFPDPKTRSRDLPKLPWGSGWSIYHPSRALPSVRANVNAISSESAYRRYWRREEDRKAKAMRRAGICLFEGWQNGMLDDRMVQAILSGCVVATVLPEVQHEALSPLIIALPRPTDSFPAGQLRPPIEAVNCAIRDMSSGQLKLRALRAFMMAREKFSPRTRIKGVFDAVKKWEEGGRGYLFPHGWRWTCTSGGQRPPWC